MRNERPRQKSRNATTPEEYGESRRVQEKASKGLSTSNELEILRSKPNLMEEILVRENMVEALKRVRRNRGAPGIDGMTTEDLKPYLKEGWPIIKARLLQGSYQPNKVKAVAIPKESGDTRLLGIPTVLDRLIQQALAQTLQGYFDSSFHKRSFGFRPKRSAHQAVEVARKELREGKEIMIDLDIEKFFDRVNHDRLMSKLKTFISDQRVLDLIRRYLNAGLSTQGVPQGGPLSPLLANIYLDDLDQELTKRGLSFVRYADDMLIFVKSQRAAERVAKGVREFLSKRLKLKVNEAKSRIGRKAGFLGFEMNRKNLQIKPENIKAFKDKIREGTKIRGGKSMEQILKDLKPIINGWGNYFAPQTTQIFKNLDKWIRRRVRACCYVQMKNGKTRIERFMKMGIRYDRAYRCAHSSRGAWHNSRGDVMQEFLNNKRLRGMGLVCLER